MKKKIYIDIDGVLLDYKTGEPAKHAEELIMFLTSGRYDCYWLTTHCKGDSASALEYLSGHFSKRAIKRLERIKATDWTDLKTEAIDLNSDFIWLEDYPFQAELSVLYRNHKQDSLYKVDLTREDDLLNVIEFIKKHGKKHKMVTRRKRFWIKAAILAVALMAGFYAIPHGRMLIWRMIDRPADYVKKISIPADRGEIFDHEGNVIATNTEVYDMHMDCCVVEDPTAWEEKSRRLAQEIALVLPERTAPEWWDYFQNARKNRRRYIPIVKNVSYSMIDSLRSLPLLNEGKYKGGRILTTKIVREYPYGTLARRTIGVWRNMSDDYLFGLERQFNEELNGEDGYSERKVGYRGGSNRQWEIAYKDETDGWNIHTTLDMSKQAVADSILKVAVEGNEDLAGGCLALMEVETGFVVTLANIHRLDNGSIGEYYNYILDHSYEPGEVAQTMTLAAALSDGIVKSLGEKIPTNHGKLTDSTNVRDDYILQYERKTGRDSITVIDGFAGSYRYVGSNLAMRYAESPDYYYQWYKTFCVNSGNFDLPMRGLDLVNPLGRDINTLISMGNGYEFTVCPMQILAFYNTIANNGRMMQPMLVNKMISGRYGSHTMFPRELNASVFRKDVADSVKKALAHSVENGTSRLLKDMPQQVIGKTGSSRQIMDPKLRQGSIDPYIDAVGRRQYASTFAGFYPADTPKYSVICVLFTKPTRQPLYGGQLPTQTVKKFIEEIEDLR